MNQTDFNIYGGASQNAPNASVQQQIFLGDQFAHTLLGCKDRPLTLVVLGAGVDATLGFPTSAQLIPRIVEYLQTDEGQQVDSLLRKSIGNVRFHFDSFVDKAIDSMAQDLDKELITICQSIKDELRVNDSLTDDQRKLGDLIVRLFRKIIDIKSGASIDGETETLIEEVFGTAVHDDSIIDFSRISYTDTFKHIITEILKRSIREADNPVLRHVSRNMLDIEQLLSQYFYGFFTGQTGYVKNYMYIAWVLWAFLVHVEQQVLPVAPAPDLFPPSHEDLPGLYAQLSGKDCQLLTFNYTSFARRSSPSAIHFHGTLSEYVDVENKNDLTIGSLHGLDLPTFFRERLAFELSFDPEHRALPIPSFLPQLRLQPVISRHYIDTWYRTRQMLLRADHILILGHSFSSTDTFFSDTLRENSDVRLTVIDKDIDTVARNLCRLLQLPPNACTRQCINGHEHRIYSNRIHLIHSDLTAVNLSDWL